MGVKQQIITILNGRRGEYLSGEELARELGVSRSAVWKAVRALQEDGNSITAVTNRGYCLLPDSDALSEEGIRGYLSPKRRALPIRVHPVTDSTNILARELAARGEAGPLAVLAGEQTRGRGRKGRSFFSPGDSGLYMSVLLRPSLPAAEAWKLTTAAAVAVAEALDAVAGADAGIKWVNDVFIGEKKVCGILTEASVDMESGGMEYAVVGIGVNVYPPEGGFPAELQQSAGAVLPHRRRDARNRIAAEILERFLAYAAQPDPPSFLSEYKRRSLVPGRQVRVLKGDAARDALALGLDDDCRLLVRYETGEEEWLTAGEVSLKL